MIVICLRRSGSSADWIRRGKQKNHGTAIITTGWTAEAKAGVSSGGAGRWRRDAGKTTFFCSLPPPPSVTRGKRKGCCLGTAQTQFPFRGGKKKEKTRKRKFLSPTSLRSCVFAVQGDVLFGTRTADLARLFDCEGLQRSRVCSQEWCEGLLAL